MRNKKGVVSLMVVLMLPVCAMSLLVGCPKSTDAVTVKESDTMTVIGNKGTVITVTSLNKTERSCNISLSYTNPDGTIQAMRFKVIFDAAFTEISVYDPVDPSSSRPMVLQLNGGKLAGVGPGGETFDLKPLIDRLR